LSPSGPVGWLFGANILSTMRCPNVETSKYFAMVAPLLAGLAEFVGYVRVVWFVSIEGVLHAYST
jgi:hypothetical protein